jgi:hypothetical protein
MPTTETHIEPSPDAELVLPRDTDGGGDALARLRRFHLAEFGTASEASAFVPALLYPFRDPARIRTEYPLVLRPGGTEPNAALCVSVGDHLESCAPEGARILRDNLLRLEKYLREGMTGERPVPARRALEEAGRTMAEALDLGGQEREALTTALAALIDATDPEALVLPFGETAPLHLLGHAARAGALRAQAAFQREVRETAARLRDRLEADRRNRPEGADDAMRASVGEAGSRLVDSTALAGVLGPRRGSRVLDEERLRRARATLEVLQGYTAAAPGITLVHDGAVPLEEGLEGWTLIDSGDPCRGAAEAFDEAAAGTADVFAAVRRAKLILEDRYEPDRHEPALAGMGWESFDREELRLVPPVAVLTGESEIASTGMASLSRLLLSGRPVQILILARPAANPGFEGNTRLSGFRFETGYLGLSHREAVVQQTAAARPVHLLQGLLNGLGATRTALHVIASGATAQGGTPAIGAWLYQGAALEGRAHPFFHYDPEAGTSWARRFTIDENPDPEEEWPRHALEVQSESGGREALTLAFTFADFALADPLYRGHLLPAPEGFRHHELIPVDEYLDLEFDTAMERIPFVWGADASGRLRRLVVSRPLALAARDRLDYWRTLRELAGVRSEHAEGAARRAREEAEAEASVKLEELQRAHAAELERARGDAVEEVVSRLTAALLEVDASTLLRPASFPALGGNVDAVAAKLLEIAAGDGDDTEPETGNDAVNRMATRLMGLLEDGDPDTEHSTREPAVGPPGTRTER